MEKTNIIRPKIIGLITAVTIIFGSLFISHVITYEHINTKLFVIELGMGLIISISLFLFPLSIYKKFIQQPLGWGIVLFLISFLISTFTSIDTTTSLFGNIDRGTGTVFILILSIITMVLGSILNKKNARNFILIPITISSLLVVVSIYAESLGWKFLENSTGGGLLGNTSVVGSYLVLSFFVTVYLFLKTNKTYLKYLYGIGLAIILINPIFINFSYFVNPQAGLFSLIGSAKSSTLAIIYGLITSLSVWLITSHKKLIKILGSVLIAVIVITSVTGFIQLVRPQTNLHKWMVNKITDVRFIYWNIGMKAFKANPIVGTGPETYGYSQQKYFNPIVMLPGYSGEIWSNKPHNMYVETLSERGIIGGIALLLLLVGFTASIIKIYKYDGDRKLIVIMSGLLAAYLLNNLLFFDTVTSYLLLFMVMTFIISATPYNKKEINSKVWQTVLKWLIGSAVLVIIPIIIIPQIQKTNRAYKEFKVPLDARSAYYQKVENTASYGSALFIAQRADFTYFNIYEPNLGSILSQNNENKKIAANAIQGMIDTLQNSFKKYPPNMQGMLAMARLASIRMVILNAGDAESLNTMKTASEEAIRISPTNPNGYILLGQEYIYELKYKEAFEEFEKARAVEPAFIQPHVALINLANLVKDSKKASFYIERAKKESPEFLSVSK